MPTFSCDLDQTSTPFPHFWEFVIGSGHAPLGLRADWQKQLLRCRDELGMRRVRFHGLLSYPMDTLICQSEQWFFSFFDIDQVFDFLVENRMQPFVELSFMPAALSSGSQTVFHYRANVTPPKDFAVWRELMQKLARHWIARYGAQEVRQWHFEVWNEPNMEGFWSAGQKEYFELYRQTVTAFKEVDGELQVGGPVTAKNAWIEDFLKFCETEKLPVDFVSTHHYPTDAFGEISDDTIGQLAAAHRGVMREQVEKAKREAGEKPLFYTEWNSSSNPRDDLHDKPYAAAFDAKTVLEMEGLVEGYSFWAFSDIFQENYMPSRPFQGGFGLLNLQGIPKPAYRAFELLHHLPTAKLKVEGAHETVDAWAFRDEANQRVTLFLTNHAFPRHKISEEDVVFTVQGHAPRAAWIERIDETHANARRMWEELGEPKYPSKREIEWMNAASVVVPEPLVVKAHNNGAQLRFSIPPHGIAAITLDFENQTAQ